MRLKLISCEVFLREMCRGISQSDYTIDPVFFRLGAHENPKQLRDQIQAAIDACDSEKYEAILLGYGLCGNAADGLQARSIPLVIPKAHDCCTVFLGSRDRFAEHFGDNLSAQWSCTGYMERDEDYLRETDTGKLLGLDKNYEEYVAQYGEENAKYIWETLHPKMEPDNYIFIDVPGTPGDRSLAKLKSVAQDKGKDVRVLEGDTRLISGLVNGNWNDDDYLIVPSGKSIQAVYDHKTVLKVNE